MLLDAGANPNAFDANMKSPVHYGKFLEEKLSIQHLHYLQIIISEPVFIISCSIPFELASEQKNKRALEMLKASGGKLSAEDNELIEAQNRVVVPSSPPKTTSLADTKNQFNERGERLEQLQNKTASLESAALEYKQAARKMKEKAKEGDWKFFGLF